jgi:hypothetical protein
MKTILVPLLTTLVDLLRSRASLHLEMLALRQQLALVASRDKHGPSSEAALADLAYLPW